MTRVFRFKNPGLLACLGALLLFAGVSGLEVMQGQTQTQIFDCPGGFTEEVAPPALMAPLAIVENPVIPKDPATGMPTLREDLAEYVANLNAAIRLGKALFWEMQAGSDNKTACATCHFHAGQDARTRNQLHPGANSLWDLAGVSDPNLLLWSGAYPFTVPLVGDTDNVTGSQGVRRSTYNGLSKSGGEQISPVPDPLFHIGDKNVRQVTRRNAPSVINAVFNHRNFHDGRAQPEFNGVNPFGNRDAGARVWYVGPLGPTPIDVHIQNASLASQAVGPVLNPVEMSAAGRTWPELGRKLLSVKPLALQYVAPSDSVLGPYANATAGLSTTYKAMIQAAFRPKWWNTTKTVRLNGKSYTVIEANMSLFWGLAVMLYQATLVSDQTPIDAYLASRASGSPNPALLADVAARIEADFGIAVTPDGIVNGLRLFELPPPPAPEPNGVGCMLCHAGAELTSASARNITHGVEPGDVVLVNAGFDQRMERMFWRIPPVAPGTDRVTLEPLLWTITEFNTRTPSVPAADAPLAVYDTGYYNIGVRPTADDASTGAADPFGNPWSVVRSAQQAYNDPSFIKVPGAGLNCGATLVKNSTGFPLLSGSLRKAERALVDGSFKVPGLRNVELNGPYFHNGGKSTLLQVMEFYDNGGDFVNAERAPLIRPLGMTSAQMRNVIAFMLALTDERVRWQRAPFDHPQLFVPNGDSSPGADDLVEVPAVGAAGGTALRPFLDLNPFAR